MIREHNVDVLLHGHTHRPGIHDVIIGRRKAKRIVLGDWYERGSMVRWNEDGPVLSPIQRRAWDV